jgi:hypothetical protein
MFLGLRLDAHFPSARMPYAADLPLEGESDAGDSEPDEPLLPPAARQARAPGGRAGLLTQCSLFSKQGCQTVREQAKAWSAATRAASMAAEPHPQHHVRPQRASVHRQQCYGGMLKAQT